MALDLTNRKRVENALHVANEEFAHVLGSVTDAVWSAEIGPEGGFAYRYYSPIVERLTGRPPEFFMAASQSWLSVVYPEDRVRLERAALEVAAGGAQHEIEYRITDLEGKVCWVRDGVRALRQPDGSRRLYGVLSDVTGRKEAERKVALQAEFCRELIRLMETSLEQGLDAPFYGRLLECAVRVNAGAQVGSLLLRGEGGRCTYVAAIGYNLAQLNRTYLWERELFRHEERSGPHPISEFSGNSELEPERKRLIYGAGPIAAVQVTMSIPIEVGGRVVAYFNLDNFSTKEAFDPEAVEMARVFAQQTAVLFKRFELEGTFEHLAHHDPLTGLPNRRLFERRLEQAVARSRAGDGPLAVMLIDLNDFKHFNDARGHAFGDTVLKSAAGLRAGDTLAR